MFKDRKRAGKLLAKKLNKFKNKKDTIVFGITRGGVVVAHEIAKELKLPLEIIVIKKIGAPLNPELAIGAVGPPATFSLARRTGPSKTVYWEKRLLKVLLVSHDYKVEASDVKNQEREELEKYLRGRTKKIEVNNKKIILVDDGVATGATVLCALKYFRKKKAAEVILVTPVIAKDTLNNIEKYFDSIIAIEIVKDLNAIGQFYQNFSQVENKEVKDIIERQYL